MYSFISIPRNASGSIHNGLDDDKFMNHMPLNKYPDPGVSFALIREPVRRLQSWYWFHVQKGRGDMSIYDGGIEEWARRGFPIHSWTDQHKLAMGLTTPLYQWEYIEINGVAEVDMLFNFADLNKSWEVITKIFNIENHGLTGTHSSIIESAVSYEFIKLTRDAFPKDFNLYNIVAAGDYQRGLEL